MKLLYKDGFTWPEAVAVTTLTVEQLNWLLDCIDLALLHKHPQRRYSRVA